VDTLLTVVGPLSCPIMDTYVHYAFPRPSVARWREISLGVGEKCSKFAEREKWEIFLKYLQK